MNKLSTITFQDPVTIEQVEISVYKIPTATPEQDGTLEWNETTLVLVEINGGGKQGVGYTYADAAAAQLIHAFYRKVILGKNVFNVPEITSSLIKHIRNNGNCGLAMMAVSAVDIALWDLKAKLLELPLYVLLGAAKERMLVYGSGGFTSYDQKQLQQQFSGWVEDGIKYVKMKIGAHPEKDVGRVKLAREVIGQDTGLFVDANGAYSTRQALQITGKISEYDVSWFEEPVSSDNLTGLKFIRDHAPVETNIVAGEYGYHLPYFKNMLSSLAVDILQADATRCGGITGFLKAGSLCEAFQIPFSSHCAPALHLHAALSIPSFYIAEYFFDHSRIESMLFDGVCIPEGGYIKPDPDRPGLGIEFKYKDAIRYKL